MGGEPAHAVKAAPSEILGYDFRAAHVNYLCRWLTTSQALFEVRNQQSFQFRFEDISILIAFDHIRGLRQVPRICRLSKPRALALQNELLGCNVHKTTKQLMQLQCAVAWAPQLPRGEGVRNRGTQKISGLVSWLNSPEKNEILLPLLQGYSPLTRRHVSRRNFKQSQGTEMWAAFRGELCIVEDFWRIWNI